MTNAQLFLVYAYVQLEKAGWSIDDVDLFEFNEAFASQSLSVCKDLGVNAAQVCVSSTRKLPPGCAQR